jgi:hypothetical protein
LSARRQGPADRRNPDERDEIPAPHAITFVG